jgi:chaperone protein EcpD
MKTLSRVFSGATLFALCLCLCAPASKASVVISSTRVVFPAQDGEVTVRLSNNGDLPTLVEAWMDAGDPNSTPDKVSVPFLVTPPLFRMDPHKDQSLRIIGSPSGLPTDRESVYWLNVLEIPPKPTTAKMADKNYLQLAIRSRLKFFYRPAKLQGDPLKAPDGLTWKTVANGKDYALEAHNPSPYYITIISVGVTSGGHDYKSADSHMLAPFGTERISVKGMDQAPAAGAPIQFATINDFGAVDSHKAGLSQ